MICKKCGNEVKEDEKFCGNCGSKSTTNKNYLIIGITFIFIFLGIIGLYTLLTDKKAQTSNNKISNNEINRNLSVLDIENKEFKINAKELINEIIDSDKRITEKNREFGGFEYSKKLEKSLTNYNIYSVRKFGSSWNISRLSFFNP